MKLKHSFRGVTVPVTEQLELLGIILNSTLNSGTYIESKAQLTAKELGVLAEVRKYFTPEQLLTVYQAQVRSCMEKLFAPLG